MSGEMNEKFKKKLEDLAETNEVGFQDVLILFQLYREKVKELFPHLSDTKLDMRSYNGLLDYYNNKKFNKGSEFAIIPFGVMNEAKDSNKKMRDEILTNFSNPTKRIEMIEKGKVMVMKTSDKVIDNKTVFYTDVYKPVSTIRKMTKMDTGEMVVVDGDLWKPGDQPIARDYRAQIQYEGREAFDNWNWSQPLYPNWKITLFGIGLFSGQKEIKNSDGTVSKKTKNIITDGLVSKVTFYGDLANPTSPKFVAKRPLWFKPCKVKAVDTKYSNALFTNVTAKGEIEGSQDKLDIIDIVSKINERINEQVEKIGNTYHSVDMNELPKEKAQKLQQLFDLHEKFLVVEYIPIIDLAGINRYHMTHKALLDANGNPIKDEDGVWDMTDFNSFALTECAFTGAYTKDGKAPKFILSDYSLPDNQSVFAKFSKGMDSEIPASSVYAVLTTSRGNQAYDVDTKTFVHNPEDAIAIPKIRGIGVILDFTKINVEQLLGDM